jgi:hypothetical protein
MFIRYAGNGIVSNASLLTNNRSLPLAAQEAQMMLETAGSLINRARSLICNALEIESPLQWTLENSNWSSEEKRQYLETFGKVVLMTHVKILSTIFPTVSF